MDEDRSIVANVRASEATPSQTVTAERRRRASASASLLAGNETRTVARTGVCGYEMEPSATQRAGLSAWRVDRRWANPTQPYGLVGLARLRICFTRRSSAYSSAI